jgi:hypothetical protein
MDWEALELIKHHSLSSLLCKTGSFIRASALSLFIFYRMSLNNTVDSRLDFWYRPHLQDFLRALRATSPSEVDTFLNDRAKLVQYMTMVNPNHCYHRSLCLFLDKTGSEIAGWMMKRQAARRLQLDSIRGPGPRRYQ